MEERFTVTDEHLALARAMYVGWDGCEFGAPAVNCKRPYGNSDVYGDMAEILGIPIREEDEEFPFEQLSRMERLHEEMRTVLQILLRNLSVAPGDYVCDKYRSNWRAVETTDAD